MISHTRGVLTQIRDGNSTNEPSMAIEANFCWKTNIEYCEHICMWCVQLVYGFIAYRGKDRVDSLVNRIYIGNSIGNQT